MYGGRPRLTATSTAQLLSVLWVTSSPRENNASAIAEGLKMCVRRPSRCQVTNSLHNTPVDTSRNWRKNQSSLNHKKRFVLKTMGNGPKPSTHWSRRDQQTSMSST